MPEAPLPTQPGRADLADGVAGALQRGIEDLKAHRKARGSMALQLSRDDSLVFGDQENGCRRLERFSRTFQGRPARCRAQLKDAAPPAIRLHDLRHTHATLLLAAGEPVKVVSERLGHTSATVTLAVYAPVMPGNQRRPLTCSPQ